MKNAPNLKYQPKDKFTEVIIFAGTDAYAHAQHWIESEGRKHGDNVPPVYLGPKQLADLANIRIIDEGRRFARVYIAGEIEPIQINAIAEKLALAGVQEAKLYKGITDREPENWRDYLQRIREQAERGEVSAMKLVTKNSDLPRPALNQMGASQRGEVLLEYYGRALAINDDSDVVHHYNGIVWEPVSDKELQRSMAKIFIDAGISYSQNAIKFAVDTMKLSLPVMGGADRNLIGFSNGVFDTRTGNFREHNKNDWLLNASELPFSPPAEGETLATHAPNFWKWLRRSVANNDRNLRITGTGMAYRAEEKEFVWRSPQTYLNPQFLERCAGVPVIIDHPEGKTIEDVGERSRIIGTVMLPYIRGDEVWGVCRIYGQEIIDYIQKARGEVSTSPSVVFCGASGGAEVPDVMGEDNFFIEGTPFLIDHVALVPLGVWDKGGKPSGVEVTTPTEEEQLAGMVREVIDAACKPALEKLEEISGRLDQLEKNRVSES
ncbi:TPA: DUF2213 domain-containing protein [Escherichia coli]